MIVMRPVELTNAQRAALSTVRRRTAVEVDAARARAVARLAAGGKGTVELDAMLAKALENGRITLSFHPDRLLSDGRTAIEAMADDGVYRSQFETQISNGSLSAFPGGDRDEWERELFGGAYQAPDVRPAERPKYGAVNLLDHPDGASPRFGSCYLRLRPEVMRRATFTFGDSYLRPEHRATAETFAVMIHALLAAVEQTRCALGAPCGDAVMAHALLMERCVPEPRVPVEVPPVRSLDDYVEAQVHGDVFLGRDAEALVADPSFRGTVIGDVLARTSDRFGVRLTYHRGFVLDVEDVDTEFRGPEMKPLARGLGQRFGAVHIDAALIGRAAASVVRDPSSWQAWGTTKETLQLLKKLWHTLVWFGEAGGGV